MTAFLNKFEKIDPILIKILKKIILMLIKRLKKSKLIEKVYIYRLFLSHLISFNIN